LDIGIGANCIYPIIGNAEYGWSFVGTDIDEKLLKIAVQ
jgi:23S rRNA (adenine1618-N6)-methyltransferase